jgi:hypothetical protein
MPTSGGVHATIIYPQVLGASVIVIVLRVARFFLVQNTKMGKSIPNSHKIYQTDIKYTK